MEPFIPTIREASPSAAEYGIIDDAMRKVTITPSAVEEEKTPVINCQGTEKIIEYGGPNNRYGKLNVILGKGAYKVVWKAIDIEEGIEVAWNSCQVNTMSISGYPYPSLFRPPRTSLPS